MSSHNYNDYFFELTYNLLYHLKENSQGTADGSIALFTVFSAPAAHSFPHTLCQKLRMQPHMLDIIIRVAPLKAFQKLIGLDGDGLVKALLSIVN